MRPLFLALALILTGCCALPSSYQVDTLPERAQAFIEILSIKNHPDKPDDRDRIWDVRLRFYENTKYNCMIQVIKLSGGHTLVEVFKMPGGRMGRCSYDHHSSTSYGSRSMFVYPGTVVGVDWTDSGFAHVARSEIGERTNIGPNFNSKYQSKHKTTGYVLEADRSLGFSWSIDAWVDGIDVVTPPENTLQPR